MYSFCVTVTKGFVPKSCLEPLHQSVHSASPTNVPSHSSNDVPTQGELQKSNQKKLKAETHSPTARLLEPPPPSYDEVVSSAESSPRLERARTSTALEHEYHSINECETDGHAYEEIPEADVSTVTLINFKYTRIYLDMLLGLIFHFILFY